MANTFGPVNPLTYIVTPDNPEDPTELKLAIEGFWTDGVRKQFVRVESTAWPMDQTPPATLVFDLLDDAAGIF